MIRVEFREPVGNVDWDRWIVDAKAGTDLTIAAVGRKEKPKINNTLYKRMKAVIFDAFSGKCAYCESEIKSNQPGDVEHYRPKGAVTDAEGKAVMIPDGRGGLEKHPGYYWLAYDWTNLLPSCEKCNRPSKAAGTRIGKGDRFPVVKSWAAGPDELAVEKPLFLHPVVDQPGRHLTFDPVTGVVGWKTKRGRACVELLGLNRDGLVERRRRAYQSAVAFAIAAVSAAESGATADAQDWIDLLDRFRAGTEPYSMAGRRAIRDKTSLLRQLRQALDG